MWRALSRVVGALAEFFLIESRPKQRKYWGVILILVSASVGQLMIRVPVQVIYLVGLAILGGVASLNFDKAIEQYARRHSSRPMVVGAQRFSPLEKSRDRLILTVSKTDLLIAAYLTQDLCFWIY